MEATTITPASSERSSGGGRIESIDLLRGLVMVLMALDHARDYFGDIRLNPQDIATTTPLLFLTRWVTHFCAPAFVFLAGVSAWLCGRRRTRGELSRFLFTRGLWLLLLEFTVIYFAWTNTFSLGFWFLQVIGAIGFAMVALSLLVFLPPSVILGLGLGLALGHDLLSGSAWVGSHWWSKLLFGGDTPANQFIVVGDGVYLLVLYALAPWLGVMLLGYGAGPLFAMETSARRRWLLGFGLVATLGFALLRALGAYGEPSTFAAQLSTLDAAGRGGELMSVVAFLNCTKYPPSLQYLAMTLGPALLFLAWDQRARGGLGRALLAFGRVPFLYYVLHLYLLHLGARTMYWLQDGVFLSPLQAAFSPQQPEWFGRGLGTAYLAWAGVVLLLLPVCRYWGRRKAEGRSALWSYL